MEFIKTFSNPNDKTYPVVKKAFSIYSWIALLGFVIFAYISNVPIDEGTKAMYKALDVIFVIFCVLAVPALAAVGFIIYVDTQRKKEHYKHFNKSKLNKHIYAFDIINAVIMGLFCCTCIYPIIYVIAGSFNQGADYAIGGVYFLPRLFTFENYTVVL